MPRASAAADNETQAPIDLTQGINFGGVSTEFEPLAEGTYRAIVSDTEVREGQQSRVPYLNVTFDLIDERGKQWGIFSFSPKALWRLKQMAIRAGCDPAAWETTLTPEQMHEQLVNREVTLKLGIEEYFPNGADTSDPKNKRKRNRIVDVLGPNQLSANGAGGGDKRRSW